MKRKHISAVALVTGALLLGSCEQTGRYQLVVAPHFEGSQSYWASERYVIDTKTGVVWQFLDMDLMQTWDPVNKTILRDSLEIDMSKK